MTRKERSQALDRAVAIGMLPTSALQRGVPESVQYLIRAGIAYDDALALRKISMTLQRWHELECGDSNNALSWCVVRGHKPPRQFYRDPETQAPMWRDGGEFEYLDAGKPYIEKHYHNENKARYVPIADREAGARRRLAKILAKYPGWQAYVQGDPRGCALYMLRPGDVPVGQNADSYYTNGLAVYK